MIDSKEGLYTIVNSSLLKKLGDQASALSELLLFDNLDGTSEGADAEFFLSQNLIKLGADMILICVTGRLKYVLDCSQSICLNPGEFAFFKEGDIVNFIEADLECKVILISLPHNIGIIEGLKGKMVSDYSYVVSPASDVFNELCSVYRMMKGKIDDETFSLREEIVYSYLITLLLLLVDAVIKTKHLQPCGGIIANDRQMDLYNKFVMSVKTNYLNHREVSFYAKDICVSPGHLARIVKNISGKTVSEWIKDYVILEAKVMLRLKKLAIYQISEALNFPNPSFFSKYFREKEGISPSQYRESLLHNVTHGK